MLSDSVCIVLDMNAILVTDGLCRADSRSLMGQSNLVGGECEFYLYEYEKRDPLSEPR